MFRQSSRRQSDSLIPLSLQQPQPDNTIQSCRWLMWTKLALSASIPLMIAIFTVVSYVQQQQINERNRQKDIDLALGQRAEDQRAANDLYYQTVFSDYIEDIANALYKQSQNQSTFTSPESKLLYIRRKTLMTLREIDSTRKSQVFIFLFENNLLPNVYSPETTISLAGADLHNITIKSPVTGRYRFNGLLLESVNLVGASFIDCEFVNGTNFIGSAMSYISFFGSMIGEMSNAARTIFDRVSFDYSNFRQTCLSNVYFHNSNLSYSNFTGAQMQAVSFTAETSLAYSDLEYATLFNVQFINTNLTGSTVKRKYLDNSQVVRNVVLPNGTWLVNNSLDLVKNGDAEKNCFSFTGTIDEWSCQNCTPSLYRHKQTILSSNSSEVSVGNCSFGESMVNGEKYRASQHIDLSNYTLFIKSGEVQFNLSAYFGSSNEECQAKRVKVSVNPWYSIVMVENFYVTSSDSNGGSIQWKYSTATGTVSAPDLPVVEINLEFNENSTGCYVDNIEVRVQRREVN